MIQTLSSVYAAAAAWRRQWYASHPEGRRRLERPVISVGNLRIGGSGKTPIVELIARVLVDRGERPAILTRGYGRRLSVPGATVVSDGTAVLVDLDRGGDEPLMLAHAVPGALVIVGADRHLSGCLAERRLGATVHLLDDGFQHFALARDVDLLVVSEDDLTDRPLPTGRLRESLSAAVKADAAIVDTDSSATAERVAQALGIAKSFRFSRVLGHPRMVATGERVDLPRGSHAFAVAGIARPERFFSDLKLLGWTIAGATTFQDHYQFVQRDVDRIAADARAASAAIVLTTEKDAVRLAACDLKSVPIAAVPLVARIEPADEFNAWLGRRLQ